MRAVCVDESGGWTETEDLEAAAGACQREGRLTWLEVDVGSGQDEAREVARRFARDPLAVEDALSARQRPKIETYEAHRFVVLYQLDEVDEQLEGRQIAVFAGEAFLLLQHDGAGRLVAQALRASRRGEREPARTAESLPSQPMLYSIKQQVSMLRRYAMPLAGWSRSSSRRKSRAATPTAPTCCSATCTTTCSGSGRRSATSTTWPRP